MVNYILIINSLLKLTFAINVFTIVGSFITFVVFSRKAFERSSIGFYCKSLAIFDLFVLFITVVGIAGQIVNVQLIASNDNTCKVVLFLSTTTLPIQGWILIVFSADQLITISMTHRFSFIRKPWFQYTCTILILVFHCCLYTTVFFNVGSKSATIANVTYYTCASNSLELQITYLVEATLIPLVAMFITTSQIVKILIKSRRKRTSIQPLNSYLDIRGRDRTFALNSVVLNISFILLTTPLVVFYISPLNDFTLSALVNVICLVFFYLNFALHFWVHLLVNSFFRNEFLIMLRIRRERRDSMFSLSHKNFSINETQI